MSPKKIVSVTLVKDNAQFTKRPATVSLANMPWQTQNLISKHMVIPCSQKCSPPNFAKLDSLPLRRFPLICIAGEVYLQAMVHLLHNVWQTATSPVWEKIV